jgi:ABC-type multidrug transport system ATPase subunit
VFCLLAANGARKATINLFLKFIQPNDGTSRVNGLDVAKRRSRPRSTWRTGAER